MTDINEIMGNLPDWMKRNFESNFHNPNEQKHATITHTRHGELAIIAMAADEIEEVAPAAAPEVFTGRITPGIFCERGDELSVWRNNNEVNVQLRCRSGVTYYGAPSPALNAEGGFDMVDCDEADRAFVRQIIGGTVQDAARSKLKAGDFNYSAFATALWTNQDRTGSAVPRAFLVFDWGNIGGNPYPKDVILFDGDKTRIFVMSRSNSTNVRAPQWSGVAK